MTNRLDSVQKMPSSAAVTVRRLVPADAGSLSACFERCYGDSYPSAIFYDVDALAERIDSGLLRSVVAIHDDHVIGHTGYSLRHPEALAAEAGNTVVDPAFRGQGVLGKMGAALRVLGIDEGFVGYNHYPTTAHAIMQTRSVQGDGVETGVMLAYIPAETNYRNLEDRPAGRLAATIVYQPLQVAPARSLFLPRAYADLISTHVLPREWLTPHPGAGAPQLDATIDARRGLLHINVQQTGRGLAAAVERALTEMPAVIAHLDLPMDDPGIEDAADSVRPFGFFFCGWLPEFTHCDVLRMQRIDKPTDQDFEPTLVNQDARKLLAHMRRETGR